MKQYIEKDILVEELEKRRSKNARNKLNLAASFEDNYLLSFLDTLEEKEGDLGNSMVCKVDWYDGFLLDYTQEQQDELLEKIGADAGDKIRVILVKE